MTWPWSVFCILFVCVFFSLFILSLVYYVFLELTFTFGITFKCIKQNVPNLTFPQRYILSIFFNLFFYFITLAKGERDDMSEFYSIVFFVTFNDLCLFFISVFFVFLLVHLCVSKRKCDFLLVFFYLLYKIYA